MYSLNGTDLKDYNILVKEFSGYLDMPKRIGITEQSWSDRNGIEAFVDSDDIKFTGRDLILTGFFESSTMQTTIQSLYDDINAFTDLVVLVTPYGTYQVYVKNGFESERLDSEFNSLKIIFREPVASFTSAIGTGSGVIGYGIDNFDFFIDYAIKITEILGRYRLPAMKKFTPVFYDNESYHVGKFQTDELIVKGYCEDLTKISKLYGLLASEDVKTLDLKFDKVRSCYVKNGCKVTNIRGTTALIEMKYRLVDPIFEYVFLGDESGNYIATSDGFKIVIK